MTLNLEQTFSEKPQIFGLKFQWQLKNCNAEISYALSKRFGLNQAITNVLVTRGFDTQEKVCSFLFSNAATDVACTTLMKDGVKAVERIKQAITQQEKILIFGDYDVDGMTATSIAMLSLLPLDAKINYFLPDRVKDGYGITAIAVQRAVAAGYTLIITVDNGTTAHPAAEAAKQCGVDMIITDHHQPKQDLPEVFALVNPHQQGCNYPYKNFCGAGVIFKLMDLLYRDMKRTLPAKVYELLMMGTIADMVYLDAENRYWIRQGLATLREQCSYSFTCLAKNSGITNGKKFWSSQDIGFAIAPQLNALGRLDNPRAAVKFLISDAAEDVETVAEILKTINEKRKLVDRSIYAQIEGQIKVGQIDLTKQNIIFAAHHDWPAGVIGLVAGKLMNNYGKPTFLFHLTADGIAKGSCRSVEAFNIFHALEECQDLLLAFGGHSCAAGLSLPQENLPILWQRLEKLLLQKVDPQELTPKLMIDSVLELPDVNHNLLHNFRLLEPFGVGNPMPNFLLQDVVLTRAPEMLKELHVKFFVFAQGVVKPVIFFNRPELLKQLLANEDKPLDLVVQISANEWGEQTRIDFIGLDIRFKP